SGKSYIQYLTEDILNSSVFCSSNTNDFLNINDVFVGNTRLSDRRENEVIYEDPFVGPDATTDPFDLNSAPLPYGGDGAMTEVMDSGGGLITTASSLAKFIHTYNVDVKDIPNTNDEIKQEACRHESSRDGDMPGTSAFAKSFSNKTVQFDFAVIF